MSVTKLSPSLTKVVRYLASGRTLTNKVALSVLNIGSLSSRISQLRKKGFQIDVSDAKGDDGSSYRKYDFKPGAQQPEYV